VDVDAEQVPIFDMATAMVAVSPSFRQTVTLLSLVCPTSELTKVRGLPPEHRSS
jgi:hypothetical protein